MLLFGTHCQELCASAKGASEFDGYVSLRGFPDNSECLLREDSETMGTRKTHSLCGGRALRKCSEKHFDVVSLFTNIPVQLATEVAQHRLKDDVSLKDCTGLDVKEVMRLLEFCMSATYLFFRGGMYQQTFRTAMGSPVSVTFANLVTEDVEERELATTDIPLRFWKRYADDMCTALPASLVQEFLDHLNGVEPSIQFTVEVESDGKLPFLDVLLQRDPDGSISTTVFRKTTHMDRYLDFMSHHPLAHKLAVVKTLHSRAVAICSDVTAKDQETGPH